MKKLLALALALALLCAMAPLAIADEPITVTVIGPESATNSSNEGYKLVQDWILENTGVLINQITLDGTNNTEKQNALLTGDKAVDLAEFYIVSDVELTQGEELSVAIEAAEGECCDRCWNYRTTVGEYNGHAHICKRCADALN